MPRDDLGGPGPAPSRVAARLAAGCGGPALIAAMLLGPFAGLWLANARFHVAAVKGCGALALASFIPVLCALSVQLKQLKSRERERAVLKTDHLALTRYYKAYDRNPMPGIVSQTWFPILVISLFSFYFALLLIYTPADLNAATYGNFLLLGHRFLASAASQDAAALQALAAGQDDAVRQSFGVMCFAYLGWYVWTVSTIFSRLVTLELVAATYYGVLVRLVVAVFVALMFQHLQAMLFDHARVPEARVPLAEAIGFGVGLFPDAALIALSSRLRSYLLATDAPTETFPLDLIQGVSGFRKLRLFEMGLDNCANLAAYNAIELFLKSNLKLAEVIDWIGQAQLLVLIGADHFVTLQRNGYRTAIDLHRACNVAGARAVLAGLLAFQDAQLVDLAAGMDEDPSFFNLVELRSHLHDDPGPRLQDALVAQA